MCVYMCDCFISGKGQHEKWHRCENDLGLFSREYLIQTPWQVGQY